jgi:hypothetical protein
MDTDVSGDILILDVLENFGEQGVNPQHGIATGPEADWAVPNPLLVWVLQIDDEIKAAFVDAERSPTWDPDRCECNGAAEWDALIHCR